MSLIITSLFRHLSAVIICLASVLPAAADGALHSLLRPVDAERIEQTPAYLATAIMQARQTAAPKVFAQLENVLAGTPLPIEGDFDPTGAWQCRYLRLGGPEGLRVFNAYRCRIYDDGAGWVLEKTSGAERLRGRFYTLSDTHLAFVGARNGPQQAQGWYGMHTTRDTVGVLERASVGTGQDRLRILFPPDQTGGTFDVMDLRR